MAELSHLFSGDLVSDTGDLARAIERLKRDGFQFRDHPIYPNVVECIVSPLDARLAAMKEFRNG